MDSSEDFHILSSRPHHRIAASLFLPQNASTPPPTIVMGHGIGAIKAAGLQPFATAFAQAGYAALAFDYLHFGSSDGQPRNLMSVPQELQDFRDVIAWVREHPDRFNTSRIVVWGTSFGGMHVTALVAEDHQLAAGIAQCPCVDGFASSLQVPFFTSLRMAIPATFDWLLSFFWERPIYLPLISNTSQPALMKGDEVMEGWARLAPPTNVDFPNKIVARSIFSLSLNRPIGKVHRSIRPLLIVLPTWDNQASLPAAEKAVKLAPLGESIRVKGGHFDLYKGGPGYEENLNGQLAFLKRVIG
ncbi:hypothetical protein MW887_011550 [Aspergillus wentii]|nr:hypothetical protein MW887_011550 [Aspergillus wentii]